VCVCVGVRMVWVYGRVVWVCTNFCVNFCEKSEEKRERRRKGRLDSAVYAS
jgi:hypothetical protein